jgi:hypothetical protein
MKIFLSVLGGLIALAVIAFFVVAFSLGSIVKKGVNRLGPEMTKSKVELGSARISPFSGHGSLGDLVVGNPTGWTSDHAFALKEITLDVQPGSLTGNHVVVNNLVIDHPDVIYETRITSSNLQDLLNNLQQANGSSKESTAKNGKPMKIEVRNFVLKNGKITVKAADRMVSLDLPTITLQNLGTDEGGLTPPQLAFAVLKAITHQAIQTAATGSLGQSLLKQAGKAGDQLRKFLGGSGTEATSPAPTANP